jgi:hypothetical protein
MKITNNNNLPLPIYNAVADSSYSRGDSDISITQLLDPPRKVALETLYGDALTSDVSSNIHALIGTAVHEKIERTAVLAELTVEQRLFTDILGWRVSGQFDYIDRDGLLWDWKTASVWEIMNEVRASREYQLNCYDFLATNHGYTVSGLRVGFIFRDWSAREALYTNGYPPNQVMVYPITRWDTGSQRTFLEERVRLHQEARETLPECTAEERWAKPDSYAAVKVGNKRASKVFESAQDASQYVAAKGVEYGVEFRPGESTRCKFYCSVADYCEQWKGLK